MPEYILFLHEDPSAFSRMSGDELQELVVRYKKWRDSLTGRNPGGKKLCGSSGRVMRGRGAKLRISDGPYAEAREVIGGFFTFTAESFDEAVEVAKECPHLEFGTIEIREVDPV